MRKTRMERGLHLKDVAVEIGVTGPMISMWETQRSVPSVAEMPAIIQFLGYVPYHSPASPGEWLKLVRTSLGYSERRLASLLGSDQRSIREWEAGCRIPSKRSVDKLRRILKVEPAF